MNLFVLRIGIGFVLGTDYVVSKAMLTEFTPRKLRGFVLSLLSIAWAGGFATAFAVGVLLTGHGSNSWRWMLVAGSVPCLLILPLRITMPESPLWLVDHGHAERAREIVHDKIGTRVDLPVRGPIPVADASRWQQLFSRAWRQRTLVACAFFTCQVIPYFAVGTFVAQVLDALNVQGARSGGLIYNGALLVGAAAGLLVVDRIPRRVFLVGSFALAAAAMLVLTLVPGLPAVATFTLFAVFALVLSAASNLVYVYLPELFPTDLRASGIGLAVAASRIGSAVGTFLLPILVDSAGVYAALGVCVVTLVLGGAICYAWAPETRDTGLANVAAAALRPTGAGDPGN
jgi:putative MFS transporter